MSENWHAPDGEPMTWDRHWRDGYEVNEQGEAVCSNCGRGDGAHSREKVIGMNRYTLYCDFYRDPNVRKAGAPQRFTPKPAAAPTVPAPTPQAEEGEAELLAMRFHEAYERLAPSFGYATREASAKPWSDVPANNRALMAAVCGEILSTSLVALEEENKRLREALDSLVDEEDCSLDHHGYCQAHFMGNPCEVAEARKLLAADHGHTEGPNAT